MKLVVIFLLLCSFSSQVTADNLPLFTNLKLPDGRSGKLQDVVDDIKKVIFDFQENIALGETMEINVYMDEYHSALLRANPEVAGVLPDSLYEALLGQAYSEIVSSSAKSMIDSFDYIAFQARSFGAYLPKEFPRWQDEVLLRSILYVAEDQKITVANIYRYTNDLNDQTRAFDLLLNILFVYQFQYDYTENKRQLGIKFKNLVLKMFRETKWDKEKEKKFLNLSFETGNGQILKWYKNAKVSFNQSLLEGPSVFCYKTLGIIQRHLETPEFVTEVQVLDIVEKFMVFGSHFKAQCGIGNLGDALSSLSFQNKEFMPLYRKLLVLQEKYLIK